MTDRARRKALRHHYEETRPEAGVYRIVNQETGKSLLGSSTNLPAERNKLAFARKTNSTGALDYRLHKDFRQLGPDAFSFEFLETLEITSEMTPRQVADDLATLEELWREKFERGQLY